MTKRPVMKEGYKYNWDEDMFNPSFFPYLNMIYNYEFYWGGRGSGKSKFISQKLVLQMTWVDHRNLICMRKQATDCRNSCFAEIYKVIQEFGLSDLWEIRENPDMRMTNRKNGNEIVFTGMDKASNIKSITFKQGNATDVWYEETVEEDDASVMIDIDNGLRSYGMKCRLICSFNPVLSEHWIHAWMDDLGKNADTLIHHSTYKDNKWNFFIDSKGICHYDQPSEYAAKLERLKFLDAYKYRVDCQGLWGTSGESVFDANKVEARMKFLEDWYKANNPKQIHFAYDVDDLDRPIISTVRPALSDIGETLIFFEPNPKRPYVASIDPANEGDDFYAMHVFDNVTDEQVAVFHSPKLGADCFIQVYGLLKMYNDALVAPEVNMGEALMGKLKEWGYDNIYQRESPKDDIHETLEKKLGFRMTVGNRALVIENLIVWTRTNMDKIYHLETLREMITFTRQMKKNKGLFMGAERGSHDDLVIALAILLKAKEQQSCEDVAEIRTLKGVWLPAELEMKVKSGLLDRGLAEDYKQDHAGGMYGLYKNTLKRRSRYARN